MYGDSSFRLPLDAVEHMELTRIRARLKKQAAQLGRRNALVLADNKKALEEGRDNLLVGRWGDRDYDYWGRRRTTTIGVG